MVGLTQNQALLSNYARPVNQVVYQQPQQQVYYQQPQQQVYYAAPQQTYAPAYAPSQTLALQPVRGNSYSPDNFNNNKPTADKNFGDFALGLVKGAGMSIYDMGHGLFFLGKGAVKAVTNPIDTITGIGGAVIHGVSHPLQTAEKVITLPFTIAKGIVKPYSNAIQQGHYGEAVGRLAMDIGVIAMSMAGGPKGPAPQPTPTTPPPVVDDIGQVADDIAPVMDDVAPVMDDVGTASGGAGNSVNTATMTHNETLAEKIINVEVKMPTNMPAGATVEIKPVINLQGANLNVGGVQQVSKGATLSGGGSAGRVASAVPPVTPVTAPITETVKTAAASSSPFNTVASAMDEVGTAASSTAGASTVAAAESGKFAAMGANIDKALKVPGQIMNSAGNMFNRVGNAFNRVGNFIANPMASFKAMPKFDPVKFAEGIAGGLRTGADLAGKGIVYAAQNPKHSLFIAGAVGRAGKATEDILMDLDLVR